MASEAQVGGVAKPDIKTLFQSLGTLPSAPAIAQEIVALAKNPHTSITQLSAVISKDAALAAKVLRIANSPLYAQRRRTRNLRQALTVMGVDAGMTLCLGFSIAGGFRSAKVGSIDYPRYWCTSLLAALGARCLGEELRLTASEDLFLAGLLQDIGVLALDRVKPGFYRDLPRGAKHADRVAYERERLGEDHAALGAWLLKSWNLPDELCRAVELSHDPEHAGPPTDDQQFTRCVALGRELATALLNADRREAIARFSDRAFAIIGLRQEQACRVIERVTELSPELGQLFETALLTPEDAITLTEEAQNLLAARSVESLRAIDTLKHTAHSLATRTEQLEDEQRRDGLTGIFNRRYLDERLAAEFAASRTGGWSLAVLFVDLDHFKRINDVFGHQAGDTVLCGTANLLRDTLRAQDVVARYGGEEFVILFPGTSRIDARRLAERLREKLSVCSHHCAGKDVIVTGSFGLAVYESENPFADGAAVVAAADAAAYDAKAAGRNCLAEHAQGEFVTGKSNNSEPG